MPSLTPYFKRIVIGSLLFISLPSCASSTHHSHKKAAPDMMANERVNLDQMVGGICRRASTGVFAQSLKSGKTLYTYKADTPFSPASNMKTITAYAALKYLGPDFRFHTQLLTDGVMAPNGVLAGNLYVKFDGDPSLQLQDLNTMVDQLSALNIHTVQGHLVIDSSRFDAEGASPGTVDTDRRYCYGAPVEAVILNENCLSMRLLPATRVGDPARLDLPYGMILPSISTVSTSSNRNCHLAMMPDSHGDYRVSGCVSANAKPASLTVPVPEGSKLGEAAMIALLQRHQISIVGDSRYTVDGTKSAMKVLVDLPSKTLAELVVPMMKNSDNLFANTLFKTIGSRYHQQPGTWQNSAAAVKAILQANGVDTASMVIIDGSGLSRNNLVSARQFVQVLQAAHRDPAISDVYFNALPVGGMNGTLKHRLGFHDTIGKVHAKTGSMKGVSTLSGYIETKNDDLILFSILVNDFNGSLYQYRSFEDSACRYLLAQHSS